MEVIEKMLFNKLPEDDGGDGMSAVEMYENEKKGSDEVSSRGNVIFDQQEDSGRLMVSVLLSQEDKDLFSEWESVILTYRAITYPLEVTVVRDVRGAFEVQDFKTAEKDKALGYAETILAASYENCHLVIESERDGMKEEEKEREDMKGKHPDEDEDWK